MVAIERFNQGGMAGNKTYHQYHDQYVPMDEESMMYANGGGVGSMMQPKKERVSFRGGGSYQGGSGKDSKGKGKGRKHSGNAGNMPYELQGMEKSHGGKPICFGYNCKSGCSNSVDGNRMCSRGKHVCARKGCGGDHPAFSDVCPNRG